MNKLKLWVLKNLVNKYYGTAVTYTVAAASSWILARMADAPGWLQDAVSSVVTALSDGKITELNTETLTVALTPLVASLIQAIIAAYQAIGIEKVQDANGSVVDGLAGPDTVKENKLANQGRPVDKN